MNQARIEFLMKLIDEDKSDPFNKYALALEYIEHAPEKSLELLKEVIENHPDYLATYYTLGNLLLELNKVGDAKLIVEKGIELAINSKESKSEKELKNLYQSILFEDE